MRWKKATGVPIYRVARNVGFFSTKSAFAPSFVDRFEHNLYKSVFSVQFVDIAPLPINPNAASLVLSVVREIPRRSLACT